MKKVISLLLSILMLMSAAMVPTWAAAATVTPKTYIAKRNYENKNGYVSGKYFVYNDSQKIKFENSKFDDVTEAYFFEPVSYIRENIIYYGFNAQVDNQFCNYLCSSDVEVVNGKNRKVLYTGKGRIYVIGGYGQSVLFKEGSQVKKYYKGKITDLFDTDETVEIFNGKLYYEKKSYDLKTKEVKSFNVEKIYTTEKYLIYINKNNNLKRLDCNGNIEMIAKNIYKYYWSNNTPTVIYSLKDKSGDEVIYKRSKNDAPVKLTTSSEMLKAVSKKDKIDYTEISVKKITAKNYKVEIDCEAYMKTDKRDVETGVIFTVNTSGRSFALKRIYNIPLPDEIPGWD